MMKEGNCIVNHEETNILFVEDDATICKSLTAHFGDIWI